MARTERCRIASRFRIGLSSADELMAASFSRCAADAAAHRGIAPCSRHAIWRLPADDAVLLAPKSADASARLGKKAVGARDTIVITNAALGSRDALSRYVMSAVAPATAVAHGPSHECRLAEPPLFLMADADAA